MRFSLPDWIVTFAHFALSLGFGFYYDRRVNGGIGKFFVIDRNIFRWATGTEQG
jgi:hypothetical protein